MVGYQCRFRAALKERSRKPVLGTVTLATLGLMVAASSPAAAAIDTPPADCNSSFDPYQYSQAALHACGIKTFPLTNVTSLPGGGSSYNYDEGNGVVMRSIVPPQGFDPTTADDAQLKEYGYPSRPSDPGRLATWQEMRRHEQRAAPPPFVAMLPNVTADTVYSPVWSGYAVTGSAGTFYEAESTYYEPTFYGSFCSSNQEVTWAGIGGYYNDGLEQAGTSHNVSGMQDHQAWDEVWPLQNIVPLSLVTNAGDYIDTETYKNSPTEFNFYVGDYTTTHSVQRTVDVPSGYYAGTSAEAIAERPQYGGVPTNLSNFGTLTFIGSWGNFTSLNSWSGTGGRHGVWMTNNGKGTGTVMASPSGIGSGGSFTDTQNSCQ